MKDRYRAFTDEFYMVGFLGKLRTAACPRDPGGCAKTLDPAAKPQDVGNLKSRRASVI